MIYPTPLEVSSPSVLFLTLTLNHCLSNSMSNNLSPSDSPHGIGRLSRVWDRTKRSVTLNPDSGESLNASVEHPVARA